MGFAGFAAYLLLLSTLIVSVDHGAALQGANPVAGPYLKSLGLAAIVVVVGIGVLLVVRDRRTVGGLIGAAVGSGFAGVLLGFLTGMPIANRMKTTTPQSLLWWLGALCLIGLPVFIFIGARVARSGELAGRASGGLGREPVRREASRGEWTGNAKGEAIDRQADMWREMGFQVGGVEAAKEAARKAAAARPSEAWFDEAVDKMASIYREHPQGFVRGSGGAPEQELRRIGEMLDRRGGMDLMRAAHAEFASRCVVLGAARNLESVWDGIGSWRG